MLPCSLMAHFVYHFRTDKPKLDEMLTLRGQGWSYTALAEKYACPKLTIRFLARKYGLGQQTISVQFTRTDYLRTTTRPSEVTIGNTGPEGRISQGKTYAEYVKEDQERRKKQQVDARL